ncbi:hypothetical protein MKW92_003338 [Papaver armeniacum]|nr:hypothetical protein MKW92_003338 [Papaver armeniacum]
MVLGELGGSLCRALAQMNNATVINEKVLIDCLNEITRALIKADVSMDLVKNLNMNIKKIVNLEGLASGLSKRKIIQQAVFNELCKMLDTGKPSFTPENGKPSVVMFVGLQGSGKTTSCMKYAYYHKKKGFKPALVCADTFRAGAFDQLKQNAAKAEIPFYGSYMESDPIKIAMEGVERFKKENCDLIIVDTSGRHQQETSLFEEMRQLAESTNPNLVIFVMDSSIGQAAFSQAQAFNRSVSVGAVIITKTEGAAKGGGALSAVAATKSPVIFLGTGEHKDDFKVFDVNTFVSHLSGMGDLSGFKEKIHDVVPPDQQQELLEKLLEGKFTMRLYRQYMLNMGSIRQLLSMLPGFCEKLMPKVDEKVYQSKIKLYTTIMDSMTNEELDSTNPKIMNEYSRVMRVARGSGCQVRDVMETLEEYKRQAKTLGAMKGLQISKNGMPCKQHMSKVLPPQILNLLKQMG